MCIRDREKALRDLRRRLGAVPLKALFEVAGPLAQPGTPGVRFAGLRIVAPIQGQGTDVGSLVEKYPSDPAPGQSAQVTATPRTLAARPVMAG